MNGLAKHTEKVFERISKLESIKPYLLVGGTALSLQIGKRLSEDLDFMKWKTGSQDKPEVAWYKRVTGYEHRKSHPRKNAEVTSSLNEFAPKSFN